MFKKIVLVSALLASVFVAGPTAPAAHAACTTSSSGSFASGSAVVANQVVVCANSSGSSSSAKSTTRSTKSVVKVPAAAVPKPACPSAVSTTAQIVSAALLGCPIPGPGKPPVTVTVAKPKTGTALVAATSSLSDQAAFTPNGVVITASKTKLLVGESVLLTSSAASHERSAVILGRIGYVRFVPSEYSWISDSGWAANDAVAIASFNGAGAKAISLVVGYRASYRFGLAEPWSDVGVVTAAAAMVLEISQPSPPQVTARLTPHLVWANCSVHPSSYRC